jgi:four helix bundle suffix protein
MGENGKNERDVNGGNHTSPASHSSHPIIPPRGDYQTLLSYQKAEVIYDLTFRFAHKYLARGDRTIDQNQTNYLLDQQLRRLEQDFLKEGGLRERMTRARLDYRNRPQEKR